MNREARKRLYDALQAGRMIAQFTDGRTFEDYESDAMLRAANETIWNVVRVHLPQLSMQLAAALGE